MDPLHPFSLSSQIPSITSRNPLELKEQAGTDLLPNS